MPIQIDKLTLLLKYLVRVGDAVSQLFNVVFLLGDNPNESLSGRCYRQAVLGPDPKKRWYYAYRGINILFFWQEDHCRSSYLMEVYRAHLLLDSVGD